MNPYVKAAHEAAMAQWRADGGDIDGPSERVIEAALATLPTADVSDEAILAALTSGDHEIRDPDGDLVSSLSLDEEDALCLLGSLRPLFDAQAAEVETLRAEVEEVRAMAAAWANNSHPALGVGLRQAAADLNAVVGESS